MARRKVIADEQVRDAHRRGRLKLAVGAGDIVTAQARDTAERLRIELTDDLPVQSQPPSTDGATAARRVLYRRHPGWTAPSKVTSIRHKKIDKLALIGAGGVGSHLAHLAANQDMADEISLVDVMPGLAESIALDLSHASGITGSAAKVSGGTSIALASDATVAVVTAGRPRTPGMLRSDLYRVNERIIQGVGEALATVAPACVVIVVSNPVDEMTALMLNATGFSREKVIGMAGTLDGSRFRSAIAEASGVAVADVSAISLGSHGDEMVPIGSRATIRERPIAEFLNDDAIAKCRSAAIDGGAAVVALRKTGSATFAPAHATVELLEHMCGIGTGAVPVSVRLQGEYGISDSVLAVPCRLGMNGVTEIVEMKLSESELNELQCAGQSIAARLQGSGI